jgi:hypothetical protein
VGEGRLARKVPPGARRLTAAYDQFAAFEDAWLAAKFVLDRRLIDDGLDGKTGHEEAHARAGAPARLA